jgi:hypothetical protein
MPQIRFRFIRVSRILFLKLALIASLFSLLQTPQVLLAKGIPPRWEAKEYQPPDDLSTPNRTAGAGTRSPRSGCPVTGKSLTALLPTSRFGVTATGYPKFFVYMPAFSSQNLSLPVEFLLADKNGNEIYKANFQTNGTSGIVTLDLPTDAGLAPLEVGQDYKWSLSIICKVSERSGDLSVEGWVRRVELNPTLSTQLKQASPQKQVELYAEAEIWQDALTTLVQLRRNIPNDPELAASWQKLMRAAGLDDMAQESLVPGSTTPRLPVSSLQR